MYFTLDHKPIKMEPMIREIVKCNKCYFETKVDILNLRYSCLLFVICAALLTTNNHMGNSITCFPPDHFFPMQQLYLERTCWVKGTNVLEDIRMTLPGKGRGGDVREINFPQWLGFFLLIVGALAKLPGTVWKTMCLKNGFHFLPSMICVSRSYMEETDMKKKREKLDFIWKRFTGFVKSQRGNKILIISFFGVKFLHLVTIVGQIIAICWFLETRFYMYGIEKFTKGKDEMADKLFPLIVFCNAEVKRLGNIHMYTVQCVISANLYCDIVFTIIWYWLYILFCINCVDCVWWIVSLRRSFKRRHYKKWKIGVHFLVLLLERILNYDVVLDITESNEVVLDITGVVQDV